MPASSMQERWRNVREGHAGASGQRRVSAFRGGTGNEGSTHMRPLRRFEEAYDAYEGIDVQVKRISDKKRFVLPLAALKATEEQSNNYQLLDDYVVWFVNWR